MMRSKDFGVALVFLLVIIALISVASDISGVGGIPRWLGMVVVPPVIGALIWALERRSVLATVTWTAPLLAVLAATWVFVEQPFDGILFIAAYTTLLAMIFSDRAATRWEGIWMART